MSIAFQRTKFMHIIDELIYTIKKRKNLLNSRHSLQFSQNFNNTKVNFIVSLYSLADFDGRFHSVVIWSKWESY